MDALAEQIARFLRTDPIALCESCLIEITKADHMAVREAIGSLALARDFDYVTRCGRCGRRGGELIIEVSDSPAPQVAGRDVRPQRWPEMPDAATREWRRLAARDAVVLAILVLAIVGGVVVAALYGDSAAYQGSLPATLRERAATFGRVEFLGWFALGALLGVAGILGVLTVALVARGHRVVEHRHSGKDDANPRVAA
jgi:hypothetical protein